ncbi:hypothetical protein BSL78_21686 [Apostichopus japonicus]|uniref:Reverse transcriptase domain-containing protein n=1 Tax=Stichopus japonicus TaxID=307972 RepID=A0A2G8K0C3_STIJA|nr:hypothetical protein BSL78_21686 [Apostichopus japonicus]
MGEHREITNYKGVKRSADSDDAELPDKLNEFYTRFDKDNNSQPSPANNTDVTAPFVIDVTSVRNNFKRLNERKAPGPDGITPKLLKICAEQLAGVYTDIFNWSLSTSEVPRSFKDATIVPIPKKGKVSGLNDYRPVALTSVPMKTFERFILSFIKSLLPEGFDRPQFAYRTNRSVEDAISIWLHGTLAHLERKCSYARVLFIDYSSAFNTIIPSQLHFKLLEHLKFPPSICNWILDFLLERKQTVRVGNNYSAAVVLNTGTPQGCVLSPLLYSLFTHDCAAVHPNSRIIKFADDTTVTGLITDDDESHYRDEVNLLVNWCHDNNLTLNVDKTKELIVDFRRNKNTKDQLIINGLL